MTLPPARRGIFTGLILDAARALGEFGATLAVTGSVSRRTQTRPLAVYDMTQRSNYDITNALSVVMITVGFGTMLLSRILAEPGATGDARQRVAGSCRSTW